MAEFCTFCGTLVPDGDAVCPDCGNSLRDEDSAPGQPGTVRAAPAPSPEMSAAPHPEPAQPLQFAPRPEPEEREIYREPAARGAEIFELIRAERSGEIISFGGFLGIFLLMLIPGVNVLLLVIWACGGCKKRTKRNFARAALLVGAILAIVAAVLINSVLDQMGDLLDLLAILQI